MKGCLRRVLTCYGPTWCWSARGSCCVSLPTCRRSWDRARLPLTRTTTPFGSEQARGTLPAREAAKRRT
eukprot:958403-Pyramimonas_sp.AAC.3